jgi:hypothetical protein
MISLGKSEKRGMNGKTETDGERNGNRRNGSWRTENRHGEKESEGHNEMNGKEKGVKRARMK